MNSNSFVTVVDTRSMGDRESTSERCWICNSADVGTIQRRHSKIPNPATGQVLRPGHQSELPRQKSVSHFLPQLSEVRTLSARPSACSFNPYSNEIYVFPSQVDKHKWIVSLWNGSAGRSDTNGLHNPAADLGQIYPLEASEEPSESTLPREEGSLLLRLPGSGGNVRELHYRKMVPSCEHVSVPANQGLRLLHTRYLDIIPRVHVRNALRGVCALLGRNISNCEFFLQKRFDKLIPGLAGCFTVSWTTVVNFGATVKKKTWEIQRGRWKIIGWCWRWRKAL